MAASESQSGAIPKPRVSLSQRRRARRLTLQALYQWQIADGEALDIIKQFREENPGKIDWEYFEEVLTKVPSQVAEIDAQLAPLLDRKPESLDPIERALLYLGTFELTHRLDVPYRVVINEAVELAKMFGATDSHKYINGVLDKLAPVLRPLEISQKRR